MIIFGLILIVGLTKLLFCVNSKQYGLPPGPKGQFVVGNLLQMFRARDAGRLTDYVGQLIRHFRSLRVIIC